MRLHENEILFKQAIQATAQRMGERGIEIPEIFIEKDYWVTLALHRIFQSETGAFAIFKGNRNFATGKRIGNNFKYYI